MNSPPRASSSHRRNSAAPSTLRSSPSTTDGQRHDHHAVRRFFIGPMPETVAAPEIRKRRSHFLDGSRQTPKDGTEGFLGLKKDRLFHLFLSEGGRKEDWSREEERGLRDELLTKWKNSGWAGVDNKKRLSNRRWIGQSFEIGQDPLGPQMILEEVPPSESPASRERELSPSPVGDSPASFGDPPPASPSQGPLSDTVTMSDGRVNSATNLINHRSSLLSTSPSQSQLPGQHDSPTSGHEKQNGQSHSEGGHGEMLLPPHRPSVLRKVQSDNNMGPKGKGRQVYFSADTDIAHTESHPVPPLEVLAREDDEVPTTSAAAAARAVVTADNIPSEGGVIMRDRMLVKVAYSRSEALPKEFNEKEAARRPDISDLEWEEYIVAWRQGRIELYEDYALPGKERLQGHKHLAFYIPLEAPATTVSLYSAVDASFCILREPSKHDRFRLRQAGLGVFIFKMKSRSRSIDWLWNLWRELEGEIPPSIEIRCPALGSRVRFEIPRFDPLGGEGYKMFSRDYVLGLCRDSLAGIPNWDVLIEEQLRNGGKLMLAWRKGTRLEWIWLDEDVNGNRRNWEVLYGLALREVRAPSHLEIHLARHHSCKVTLSNGERMAEPLAVEGYAYRRQKKSGTRTRIYLAVHDGLIFTMRAQNAHPPAPPTPGFSKENEDRVPCAFSSREIEARRGAEQILGAVGCISIRNIASVQMTALEPGAGQTSPTPGAEDAEFDILSQNDPARSQGDNETTSTVFGGAYTKARKSFELVMHSGDVLKFEAPNRAAAQEWVSHLQQHLEYWTRRHRLDAHSEMELVKLSTGQPNVVCNRLGDSKIVPELPDPDAASPSLVKFWSTCVLEGCRPIVKSGKLFAKKGVRNQYKYILMVLVSGHLVMFHITKTRPAFHHQSRVISLLDAYTYSGQLAVMLLPRGPESRSTVTPRRYADGLEAADNEEDNTFLLWYRPQPAGWKYEDNAANPTETVPPLGGKHKFHVFKARSKLERDAWCWAINCEIERVVRAAKGRETKVRNSGELERSKCK
ncbi:hypothetical protein BOTBODRAFT_57377 [Botryobasidium botryosum FD-172 SS1]|uniref:PH domain-containing protein n=1 Tax=Botryobasidium botryosum (strain FD-172 SS1) TaxID=930990 RepID=A0A067M791_BOTB1|nr:hypothetical protein BOTBODRAFT_57377 [Botryobasidium botryosum FD-172 SS1]